MPLGKCLKHTFTCIQFLGHRMNSSKGGSSVRLNCRYATKILDKEKGGSRHLDSANSLDSQICNEIPNPAFSIP